jgi:hypothetical protein
MVHKRLFVLLTLFIVIAGCTNQSQLHLPPAPASDFKADICEGKAPLTVTFTALCTGDITDWHWDFGDGQFSEQPGIIHTYSIAGKYTVSLVVKGPGGSDVETKTDFINVSDISNDTKDLPDSSIDWTEAGNYIGQTKVVKGTIVGTYYADKVKGKPTFLNFNMPYKGYFTCLIWGSDRSKFTREFKTNPESYLLNKHVRVKGLIIEYPKGSGVPEIILKDPSQIEIVDE